MRQNQVLWTLNLQKLIKPLKTSLKTTFNQFQVNLHTHVFCINQLDEKHIICGQMNGWIDVVSIEDGSVLLSKELRHIAGNITMIIPTGRDKEIMLGT